MRVTRQLTFAELVGTFGHDSANEFAAERRVWAVVDTLSGEVLSDLPFLTKQEANQGYEDVPYED